MPEFDETLGQKLDGLGWETGAVLPGALYEKITQYLKHADGGTAHAINPKDWLIVVSQTCDVVARKREQEEFVEILYCKPISKIDPKKANLHSTRWLNFRPNKTLHPNVNLAAHALHDKYQIPRELLALEKPDKDRTLSANAVLLIQKWYALRWSRPAWPNALAKLLQPQDEGMEAALKQLTDDRTELRVKWRYPDNNHDAYRAVVYLVLDEETWHKDLAYRTTAMKAFNSFITVLRKCERIEVDDLSGVMSGAQFTWQLSRQTDMWDYANLTDND